jgi:peptide/nickel transport system ATP-binding protein
MTPALELRDVSKRFPLRKSLPFSAREYVHAVDHVSLEVRPGQTLGLVGESGCGKSTVGRIATRFLAPTEGSVIVDGVDISKLRGDALRTARTRTQLVFQDPYASLDPRHRLTDIVGEPLQIRRERPQAVASAVDEYLQRVGLDPSAADRYPHELSGGQRQRVAIARALASNPSLLVLDEPVSSLDVSIQAQVVSLLQDLQRDMGLSYLFISHDLSVVRHLSDYIAVMYLGRVVERGDPATVLTRPAHPYTSALLSAVPIEHPRQRLTLKRRLLEGDVPSATNPPSGCHFRLRCWKAQERCTVEVPALIADGPDRFVACHFPESTSVTISTSSVLDPSKRPEKDNQDA